MDRVELEELKDNKNPNLLKRHKNNKTNNIENEEISNNLPIYENSDFIEKTNKEIKKVEEIEPPIIPVQERVALRKWELNPKQLPSMGKVYPKNARIFYNEYTYTEIKYFSGQIEYTELDQIFKLILQGISTENMDKYTITFDDFVFIALQRKIQTFPNDKITYFPDCPKCQRISPKKYSYASFATYDLELPIKQLPIKEVFNIYKSTEDGLNFKEEKLELQFAPLTIGRFFEIYNNKLDENENAYRIFQVINKDALELMQNEFSVVNFENGEKLEKIELILNHGFKYKKDICNLPTINPDTGEEILDEKNRKILCNGQLEFEVDTSYELVIPFRPTYFSN